MNKHFRMPSLLATELKCFVLAIKYCHHVRHPFFSACSRPVLLLSTVSSDTQGMGIIAVIQQQLDYQFGALQILAKFVWIYTIVLLAVTLFLYLLRLYRYPKHVAYELHHNLIETSCLASIAITYTSIIQMAALQYGHTHGIAISIYVLWWINAFLSTVVIVAIPYTQLRLQPSGIGNVPPAVVLPVIAGLTCAAGGGAICNATPLGPRLQVPLVIVACLLVGAGLSLGLAYDAVILFQHFSDFYPPVEKVWHDMILCGPFGQGGLVYNFSERL